MNDQRLQDRMAALVADQPPMRNGSAHDLRRGRRRVAVRRGGAVVGAAGLAAAVATGVALAGNADRADAPVAGVPDVTEAVDPLVERCSQVDNGPLDPVEYGAGARVLTAQTDASGDVSAVILSSDRSTWAECHVTTDPGAEFNGWAARYPIAPAQQQREGSEQNSFGYGGGSIAYVDRFPADVARVELDFGRGLVLAAETVDGWVAFQREDERFGTNMALPAITLYGAHGQVLADESMAPGDASLPVEYRTLVPSPLPASD